MYLLTYLFIIHLFFFHIRSLNQRREVTALNRQGTQQQRPESPTVAPFGMRINTEYINSTTGTPSNALYCSHDDICELQHIMPLEISFSAWQLQRQQCVGAQGQRLGAEQDQLPCGSTGTSSGNCQETETCMVRACNTPRQPLQNHPSGHHCGWVTPWSAEEMLDGQHQKVDIHAHARTAHKDLLQKSLEADLS